jgi:hypothetical protein
LLAVSPAVASASKTQESMFQDDPLLVGTKASTTMIPTLDELKTLGVDRIRVSLFWSDVAPENTQPQKPNFDSSDPGAYPTGSWDKFDRLLVAAKERGIFVNVNVTAPLPRWGSMGASPRPEIQDTFKPDPVEFGRFVAAAGKRYSGDYQGLPRVDYWSIYNEPNQGGWLTPQWKPDPRAPSKFVEASPELYRNLLRTSYQALADTGHGADTILIGDTAPKGLKNRKGFAISLDAMKFLRGLYCVDKNRQPYKGTSATVRGCPASGAQFVADNPALFKATGYAHHPYELYLAPNRKAAGKDWITIANLPTLTAELKALYQRYHQKPQTARGTPLYLTEYGYQTPPDPLGIPLARQAAYINQAEQIAYRNPLVRTLCQFLLVDQPPVAGVANNRIAYRTFQSGLRKLGGKKKPAYRAYVTPIFVSKTRVRRGQSAKLFGLLRTADPAKPVKVQIQFRAKGSTKWKTRKTVSTAAPRHYLSAKVAIRSAGAVRLSWKNGTTQVTSRSVTVAIRR